jgi:hypothetical protein
MRRQRGTIMTDADSTREEFISEPIEPEAGSFDPSMMAQGLASLPGAFTWRGRRYVIEECLEHIKQTSREGGSAVGDRYLRRQRFRVRLNTGQTATLYFERQSRPGVSARTAKKRWFLYSLSSE